MFTSRRIDLFKCIYLPRGDLIGIERLCSERVAAERAAGQTERNAPADEAFTRDEETVSQNREISQWKDDT